MSMARVLPGEDMVKSAKVDTNKLVKILGAITAAGAVASPIATHYIGGAIQKSKEQKAMDESWQRIITKVPELNNEDAKETFESMYDLSPSIMKHPRFAIPAIRTADEYGTGGIPVDLASKLVNIDAARTKGSPDFNTKLLSGISTGMGIMKGVSDIGSGREEKAYRQSVDASRAARETEKLEEASRVNIHKRLADYTRMSGEERQEYNNRAIELGLGPI